MSSLDMVFSPFAVKSLSLKNRLVMAPMYTGYGTEAGAFTQKLLDHYVTRAKGGVALIIQEATSVRQEGLGGERWLGIWDDSYIAGYKQLVQAVHDHGAKIALQIHHAGRQTDTTITFGLQPVAPTAFADAAYPNPPHALTIPEIIAIEDAFADAAARGMAAGYDAIELHGGHGYLINQFMSPLINTRQDDYGGTLANRLRFPTNIIAKVRRVIGADIPLSFRMSVDEYRDGGYGLPESQQMVPLLVAAGVDLIHASAGSGAAAYPATCASMSMPRGNLVHLSEGVKQVSTVPVIAIGRIVPITMAEEILRAGKADLIANGRQYLADPEFPNKAKAGQLDDIRECIGCHQGCRQHPRSCLVNVETGYERELALVPAAQAKKVVVIGAGPGGLEAARVAALRGHSVTLFEQRAEVGGTFRVGALTPHKQDINVFVDYLDGQVRKLGVDVRLSHPATVAEIGALHPDAVIVATGGDPVVPERPGVDRPHVVIAEDILTRDAPVGQRVIVMGAGMTGCEIAEHLAEKGKQVSIVTRVAAVDQICADMPPQPRGLMMRRLKSLGVQFLTGTSLEAIAEREVVVRHGAEQTSLPADTVVLAQGYRPNRRLADELASLGVPVQVVGDAAECRTAKEAIREGAVAARQI